MHLPGCDFAPHYVETPAGDSEQQALRMHYLDEGPQAPGEAVVLLHGEPSWCFLYRTVVAALQEAGHRVIAPGLVGFGRSDKLASRTDHTYARHVAWLRSVLFGRLALDDIALFCQDRGGLLGLRLVAYDPRRFRRIIAANTGLPTGERGMTDAFLAWQRFSKEAPELPIGRIVDTGTVSTLPPEVIAAYDAPFPDGRCKEGARQLPALVPTSPDDPASADNRRAWDTLRTFDRPFLCAFGDRDPITAGG